MMNNKIQLYFMDTCGYCKTVKEHLTANNIEFEAKNTKDFADEWQDLVTLTGMGNTPTIVRGNDIYAPGRDYGNPEGLVQALSLEPITADNGRVLLERIKTLNYNMGMAFGRVDNLLRSIESKLTHDED